MKIAVIDPGGSTGGVGRLVREFLPALRLCKPDWHIDYFASGSYIKKEKMREFTTFHQIGVKTLHSLTLSNMSLFGMSETGKFIGYLQQKYGKWLPIFLSGAVHKELERKVKGYDVAFFPWIFRFECPNLDCPMVGIVHDFNYKYHFCAKGFHPWTREYLNHTIPQWLEKITPVVSSRFIQSEMEKFYPGKKGNVIHLPPLSYPMKNSGSKRDKPYALFPCSTAAPHKNVGALLAAFNILKMKGHSIQLVLTGHGTEHIRGSLCQEGVQLSTSEECDVEGIGYVDHEEMDLLMQNATVVVNPSLYEAGNGPGLDAWIRGVPVAMSNIPAFVEHLSVLGVKAALFDPRSPADIAEKIESILLNPQVALSNALISKEAISQFNWNKTVKEYINIFEGLKNDQNTCLST